MDTSKFKISYKSDFEFKPHNTALVVAGCASCVWDDIDKIELNKKDVLAVNDIGLYLFRITHWASCHPVIINSGSAIRRVRLDHCRREDSFLSHIPDYSSNEGLADFIWTIPQLQGTSGMFGTLIGLYLGYSKIILAGIPLDSSPHFYAQKSKYSNFDREGIHKSWKKINDLIFEDKVRSLSGWTRELLGEPTKEWLNGK